MAKKSNARDLVKFTLGGREYLVKASIALAAVIEEVTGKSTARLLHSFANGSGTIADAADVIRAALANGNELETRAAMFARLENERDFMHAHKLATSLLAEFYKPREDTPTGNAEAVTTTT